MGLRNDIETATDSEWSIAAQREPLIAALASSPKTNRAQVDKVAETLGHSRAMIYRLLARYRKDPRTSSLLPNRAGRKTGRPVLDEDVESVVSCCIKSFFLKPEKPATAALHRLILVECSKAGLNPPSYKAVRARIRSLDLEEVARHRLGTRVARDRYRAVKPGGLRPSRPFDLFQIASRGSRFY